MRYNIDMQKPIKLNQRDLNKRRMIILAQIAIALPLFMFGFSESMRSAGWVAYFHEFGHVFGAYTSGGSGEILNSHLSQSYGGVDWWITMWGPLGETVFLTLAWMLAVRFRKYVIGAVFFGAAHGSIYFNYAVSTEIVYNGIVLYLYTVTSAIIVVSGWWKFFVQIVAQLTGKRRLTVKKSRYSIEVQGGGLWLKKNPAR